jgi:hypothetical protein
MTRMTSDRRVTYQMVGRLERQFGQERSPRAQRERPKQWWYALSKHTKQHTNERNKAQRINQSINQSIKLVTIQWEQRQENNGPCAELRS